MSDTKRRSVNWDLLRSLAMFLVVVVHTPHSIGGELAWGSSNDWYISGLVSTIAIICDPIFFMLSGYFALKAFNKNLKDYYLNKVSTIILPLVLYSILLYLFANKHDFAAMNIEGYFSFSANLLAGGWWFIPTLIPCLVAAPFISKGLEALSDKAVFVLCAVIMALAGWGLGMDLLAWIGTQTGIETLSSFSAMTTLLLPPGMLTASLGYFQFFVLGGLFRRLAPHLRGKAGTIVIGIGLAFWAQDILFAAFNIPRNDPSYSWVFAAFGIMVLFDRIHITAKIPSRIINWTAQRSYSIYLLQYTTIGLSSKLIYDYALLGNVSEMDALLRVIMFVVYVILAYLLALAAASIFDPLLLSNLQKLFNRVVRGKRKESA